MQENIYSPSLNSGEIKQTKSYDINKLVYVAFLGGVIAITALGVKNAKWLQLEKRSIQILVTISSILFILKYAFVYMITHELIDINRSLVRPSSVFFGVICYFIYYFFLKRPFKEHCVIFGQTESLYKDGILWVASAALIEAVLVVFVSSL